MAIMVAIFSLCQSRALFPVGRKTPQVREKQREKDSPYSKPSVFVGTHNYCILSWWLRPRRLLNIFFTVCLLGFSFSPLYFFFSPHSRTRLALNTSFPTHTERFVLGPVQCAWVTVYQIRSRTQREREREVIHSSWALAPGGVCAYTDKEPSQEESRCCHGNMLWSRNGGDFCEAAKENIKSDKSGMLHR